MGCCGELVNEAGLASHRHTRERPAAAERIATERAVGFCEVSGRQPMSSTCPAMLRLRYAEMVELEVSLFT